MVSRSSNNKCQYRAIDLKGTISYVTLKLSLVKVGKPICIDLVAQVAKVEIEVKPIRNCVYAEYFRSL